MHAADCSTSSPTSVGLWRRNPPAPPIPGFKGRQPAVGHDLDVKRFPPAGQAKQTVEPDGSIVLRRQPNARVRTARTAELDFCIYEMVGGSSFVLRRPSNLCYLVSLCLRGTTEVWDNRGVAQLTPGQLRLQVVEDGPTLQTRLGSAGLFVLIPAELVRKARRDGRSRSDQAISPSSPAALVLEPDSLAANFLRDCLRQAADLLAKSAEPRQLNRVGSLVLALLIESLAEHWVAAPPSEPQSAAWYVLAAEKHIDQHPFDAISMKDLAQAAGVSVRTLHEGFRKHRGHSPMQYVRKKRMESIRTELLAPECRTTVTDAALKCGFNHLGRFSAYYALEFGERPSDTLRAAKLIPHTAGSRRLAV